jgi:hypothetical protein
LGKKKESKLDYMFRSRKNRDGKGKGNRAVANCDEGGTRWSGKHLIFN